MEIIYCHGLPGSAHEISHLLDSSAPPVFIVGPEDDDRLTAHLSANNIQAAHIIGFSLGAMTAMEIAAKYPALTQKLTLIAPAAPLELGHFLPDMAGEAVFQAAQRGPIVFGLLTLLQRIGVTLAPKQIIHTMFRGAPPAELKLLESPRFQSALVHSLHYSLGKNAKAYKAQILRYVQPWAQTLEELPCPVTIHHGDADDWVPIAMGRALAAAISQPVNFAVHPQLGHYSTLHAVLPEVLNAD